MLVNRIPTIFEAGIVKWVVIPILLSGLVYMVGYRTFGVQKCQDLCEDSGYSSGIHIPPDRLGFGEKCVCKDPLELGKELKLEIPFAE